MNKYLYLLVLVILFAFNKSFSQEYIWPTNASNYLTSSFCEFRPYHFHSGIDVKTWGKSGYKVYSIEDGFVARIRVSPFGYGRAVYVHHPDGRYSVYGHLQKFAPKIEKLVKNAQKERNRFSVELFFKDGVIPVKKGEVIAFTGRSGTISPHLHFEIRDARQRPINPMKNGFKIVDKNPPVVTAVSFSPLNYNSIVKRDYKPVIVKVRRQKYGIYTQKDILELWGDIGIGVAVYDKDGNVSNKYAPYSIELLIDSTQVYKIQYDKFSFNETRHIIVDRDFRLMKRGFGFINKLYKDVGNNLPFYSNYKTYDGVVRARPQESGGIGIGIHSYKIVLEDASGNVSECSGKFNVVETIVTNNISYSEVKKYGSASDTLSVEGDVYDDFIRLQIDTPENVKGIPFINVYCNGTFESRINTIKSNKGLYAASYPLSGTTAKKLRFNAQCYTDSAFAEGEYLINISPVTAEGGILVSEDKKCTVEFPKGALYKTYWGSIVEGDKTNETVDKTYAIEPFDVPIRTRAYISLKYQKDYQNIDKIGIYGLSRNKWKYSKSDIEEQSAFIESSIREFQNYTLIKDTEPPVITRIRPKNGSNIKSRKPKITVGFEDKLSGIKGEESIVFKLDGVRVISEYDPSMDRVFYIPDEPLNTGKHKIDCEITDNMNNTKSIESYFTIIQ
ncbi:M23 family metallopeptidase [candidate division KSB1 bacterium]